MKKLSQFILSVLVVCASATSAFAAHYADFYVIPVASHTGGANGTNWRSDVSIHNFSTAPLTVEFVLIESGGDDFENVEPLILPSGETSVTIPGLGNVRLVDVLGAIETERAGALLVGAERPFAVISRSYNQRSDGTIGQTVPPVQKFLENISGDTDNGAAVAYLPGLISNAEYRTNIGFVAGTTNSAMEVEILLRGASGDALGTRRFKIEAGTFLHLQGSSKGFNSANFDIGSATVRIVSGDGAVVPYASVIDNRTSDAVFVLGQFADNAVFAKTPQPSAFRLKFNQIFGH